MSRWTVNWYTAVVFLASMPAAQAYDTVHFEGSTAYQEPGGVLIFDNVRATGNGVTLNDALQFNYKFDLRSLGFLLTKQTRFKNVGVFNWPLMYRLLSR